MRARGAQVTDIVVLVVAADDGVMPQTIEAINHAKAAGVPIVVAINKIDLPAADADRVKQELAAARRGGRGVRRQDASRVEISAKKGTNVDKLLEMILLAGRAARPQGRPRRAAPRARCSRRASSRAAASWRPCWCRRARCASATRSSPASTAGRVRAMFDERGRAVKAAGPSTPVEVLGWNGTPGAGDIFAAFEDEREARDIGEQAPGAAPRARVPRAPARSGSPTSTRA